MHLASAAFVPLQLVPRTHKTRVLLMFVSCFTTADRAGEVPNTDSEPELEEPEPWSQVCRNCKRRVGGRRLGLRPVYTVGRDIHASLHRTTLGLCQGVLPGRAAGDERTLRTEGDTEPSLVDSPSRIRHLLGDYSGSSSGGSESAGDDAAQSSLPGFMLIGAQALRSKRRSRKKKRKGSAAVAPLGGSTEDAAAAVRTSCCRSGRP